MFHVRILAQYTPDLADEKEGTNGSETRPMLRFSLSHCLGGRALQSNGDSGLVFVNSKLAKQATMDGQRALEVILPFFPKLFMARRAAGVEPCHIFQNRDARNDASDAIKRALTGDHGAPYQIPADASVLVGAYVHTATQTQQECETKAGEAVLLLRDVFHAKQPEADFVQTTGTETLVKGTLRVLKAELLQNQAKVKASRMLTYTAVGSEPQLFPELKASKFITEAMLQFQARVTKEMNMRAVNGMGIFGYDSIDAAMTADKTATGMDLTRTPDPPVLQKTVNKYMKRVHCPYFQTEIMMQPGAVYIATMPDTPPPVAFFVTQLTIACDRARVAPGHLLRVMKAQEQSCDLLPAMVHAVGVFGEFFNVLATTRVYLPDFVNNGGHTLHVSKDRRLKHAKADATYEMTEDFKAEDVNAADDCEGLGWKCAVVAEMFRKVDLGVAATSETADYVRVLTHFKGLLDIYSVHLVLAGVTAPKLEGDQKSEEEAAHTFCALIPIVRLLGHVDDAGARTGTASAFKTSQAAMHANMIALPWHVHLPVLILEGTARAPALPLPILEYYEGKRQAAAKKLIQRRMKLQKGIVSALSRANLGKFAHFIQFPIPPTGRADDGTISKFYKIMGSSFTTLAREEGILDVAFATQQSDGSFVSTIPFEKFVAPKWDHDVTFVPFNRLEPAYQKWINAVHALQQPTPTIKFNEGVEVKAPPGFDGLPTVPDREDEDVAEFPLPSAGLTITLRDEDVRQNPAVLTKIGDALRSIEGAKVSVKSYYVSEPSVHGESEELPLNIVHDFFVE